MYSAKNELKFTYRIISNKEFDVSKLKQQFPILSKKEALKINKPYLTNKKKMANLLFAYKNYIFQLEILIQNF
jgi:hypothetical protein